MTSVRIGTQVVPSTELVHMEDSSNKVHDAALLRAELEEKGFVLLRNQLSPEKLRKCKSVVTNVLHTDFQVVDTEKGTLEEAHILSGNNGMLLTGYTTITHHKDVLDVIEGSELTSIFERIFGESPVTYDTKWVRVMGTEELTEEHSDFYRFSHSANRLYTCWIPMDSYRVSEGTLAIVKNSHRYSGYNASDHSFQESKTELPPEFEEVQRNGDVEWLCSDFNIGDILIFDIRAVHASTANTTERFRISMDTRWQPRSVAENSGYHSQWKFFS